MTFENVLYNIGAGLPFVLAFAAASGFGWFIRREVGIAACAGVMASIINFGAAIQQAGDPFTQEQAGIAAGASIVSSVAAFVALHAAGLQMRDEAEKHGRLVTAIGALMLVIVGAIASMVATMLLTGSPWVTSYTESLFTYSIILAGSTYAITEWQGREVASTPDGSIDTGESIDTKIT